MRVGASTAMGSDDMVRGSSSSLVLSQEYCSMKAFILGQVVVIRLNSSGGDGWVTCILLSWLLLPRLGRA